MKLLQLFLIPLLGAGLPALAEDTPSNEDFLRWPFPAVIIMGDYLYVDGGEISQLHDGKNGSTLHPSDSVNSTFALPLKTTWTNATVPLTTSSKPDSVPRLNNQAIFRSPDSSSFYVWGGVTAYFATPPPLEMWKFTVSSSEEGKGSWTKEEPNNIVTFSSLIRTVEGAYAQSRNTAYYLGGYADKQTDTSVADGTTLAVPGLLEFNMEKGEWKNVSTTGAIYEHGTLVAGSAEFAPFGEQGVLLFMGGGTGVVSTTNGGWKEVDFNTLTLYDVKSAKFFTQKTTGARPTPRQRFCTSAVQGPNGTYEIFIYGGASSQAGATTDSVYVLSLPGFVFFKSDAARSTLRADHACVPVPDSRQMISIRGTERHLGFPDSLLSKDPWTRSIGVFDMTSMAWKDSYDADAGSYESPAVVKQWYDQGGLASVEWDSKEVETLFETKAPDESSSDPGKESSSDGNGKGGENGGGSKKSNAGAIAGGVVGGLALAALLGVGAWWFIRKRRKLPMLHPGELEGENKVIPETHAADIYSNGYSGGVSPTPAYNGPTGPVPIELPAEHGFSELNSPHGAHEMSASTKRGYEF